ncbi:phage tail sheath family protein [Clostridium sp. MCC353]|uniref:phage tail sheath family protein n=1 Tax=Clostridium sp. MCC353 TaxID=2592646 RepID=UPI001C02F838|nr:phage tail sheath C-terminal domain-containing protein [Clostridium sp. MCC353]MBT9777198.1 phage tail sheath family protein [Clostridium sp. MCC353]
MAEYLSPGVYVEEFDSGINTIEGVDTSTAGFIGMAERGPVLGLPRLVTNFEDFKRNYGGYLSVGEYGDYRFLAYAVEHFFNNGGSRCFIMRVSPQDAACATAAVPSKDDCILKLTAKNPGVWGNNLKVNISPSRKAKTQILEVLETAAGRCYSVKSSSGFYEGDVVCFTDGREVIYNRVEKIRDNIIAFEKEFALDVVDKNLLPERVISTCEFNMEIRNDDIVESYNDLSFNMQIPNYIERKLAKSELVTAVYAGHDLRSAIPPFVQLAEEGRAAVTVSFTNGSNGNVRRMAAEDFVGRDGGAGKRSGIQAFADNDVVSVIAVPGVTDPGVQLALTAHCEKQASRFAVLDMPKEARKIQDILAHRDIFDSSYAAVYHPWLMVFDPLDKKEIAIPPSGSVMGIYARNDAARGVHKAPANEVVRSCVGLDVQFNNGDQDILNPKGVNLIRAIPGMGIRVWGARTASSNSNWKYINVRRLFIFIEKSIKDNISWVVYEPNNEVLWRRVQQTIEIFLTTLWRNGALAGVTPEEAFFVNIGWSTMSQDDIDKGRLICLIGAAPVKPAEFVIFRITQKTGEAQ